MRRDRTDEAAARARWLAELAEALFQAQDMAWRYGQASEHSAEAMDLYARLEAVRGEVRALQLRPVPSDDEEHQPKWISQSPWCAPDRSARD